MSKGHLDRINGADIKGLIPLGYNAVAILRIEKKLNGWRSAGIPSAPAKSAAAEPARAMPPSKRGQKSRAVVSSGFARTRNTLIY